MSVHPVEKLWREIGLPEYFLGNGGTNTKLYALYDAIIEECAKIADCVMNDADNQAQHLSYSELYGMNCRSEAASEIADEIRSLTSAKGKSDET
jgi:hypothetical protein